MLNHNLIKAPKKKLNYKIAGISVINNKITFNPYGFADLSALNKLLSENLELYIKETTWKLFKYDVDLSPYFQTIEHHIITKFGDLYGGSLPNSLSSEDVKKLVRRNLIRN